MQPPILATGAFAWKAGHEAIRTGAFRFRQTYEDRAYIELKYYAAQQAHRHIDQMKRQFDLTPSQWLQVFRTFVRAFANGAFDEAAQQGERYVDGDL
jgi:hypothetical protein